MQGKGVALFLHFLGFRWFVLFVLSFIFLAVFGLILLGFLD